jgi:DNA-binding response OmpR family regulator
MPTVLVLEDNPDILEMVTFILEGEGYTVLPESRGRAVLDRVGRSPVDLVLLDLRIPDMDGYEVLCALRATPGDRALPVIVLSAKTAPEDRDLAFSLGACDFVEKPFTVDGLLAAVRKQLAGASK